VQSRAGGFCRSVCGDQSTPSVYTVPVACMPQAQCRSLLEITKNII